MAAKKFTVAKDEAGMRLDLFLTERLPAQAGLEDFSRSWIQVLIERGNVRVGRRKPVKSYKLKVGENVFVTPEPPPEISLEPDRSLDDKIKIVFENKDFVVVNKPAGLVTHPSSSTPRGTLVNWLLWRYPTIRSIGEDRLRPGLVHRLDKNTSGLMVVARNQASFQWLKKAFQRRAVRKNYYALVHGALEQDKGIISYPIARSRRDPTRQVAYRSQKEAPPTAKPALTNWRVLKRYAGFTLLELTPKTGRMHQLRVHLKAIGHPVAGDDKYAPRKLRPPKNLTRMFLHAFSLEFENPRAEKFSFSAQLPAGLRRILKNLPSVLE